MNDYSILRKALNYISDDFSLPISLSEYKIGSRVLDSFSVSLEDDNKLKVYNNSNGRIKRIGYIEDGKFRVDSSQLFDLDDKSNNNSFIINHSTGSGYLDKYAALRPNNSGNLITENEGENNHYLDNIDGQAGKNTINALLFSID